MSKPIVELAGLQTENRNPRSANIDRVSAEELCRILNREDAQVPKAVEPHIPVIAEAIEVLTERVRNGGRVFYIGAGTSGRLGVLDASEIPPTYSAPSGQFVAFIAGGDGALRTAKEGAEDDRDAAEVELKEQRFDPKVDSLIGIASSGRTPYVLGGLAFVRAVGGVTIGLVCVQPSAVGNEGNADYLIAPVTGPEVVTGSTRMKAGTVTKLVLNMISTGIMIKLGKTYGNMMIDLKATNIKLQQRAKNILRFVGGASCTQSDEELEQILAASNGSVKLAAATIVLGVPVDKAKQRLEKHHGVLAKVFEEEREKQVYGQQQDEGLILCVDAGGTGCKAIVTAKDGSTGNGVAGPCNVSNVGVDAALSTIAVAIQKAVDTCSATRGRQWQSIRFSSAWVGMAGYARPALAKPIQSALSEMLKMSTEDNKLRVTTDIDMLPAAVASDGNLESVIVLVAGTGSIAMSYETVGGVFQRTSRAGGWGHLLGDDGSGYGIGREALRVALSAADNYAMQPKEGDGHMSFDDSPLLYRRIVEHFQSQYPNSRPEDLLSTIIMPEAAPPTSTDEDTTLATTKRIAGVAPVVLSLRDEDEDAHRIFDAGVSSLVKLVISLFKAKSNVPSKTGLVLAGGMVQNEKYRETILMSIKAEIGAPRSVEVVSEPAAAAASYLRSKLDS